MKILNFGSLNIDTTLFVDGFAAAGKTISASSMKQSFGGKGLNQSVAMARAGATVFHAGKVGRDGASLRDFLHECGVDVSYVATSDKPTGCAMIQVDKRGENCIVVYGGANRDISREYADEVLSHFGAGDMAVLQNEISNVGYIARRAHEKGMTVVLNPSPIDGLDVDMNDVDILILNENEAEALFGSADAEKVAGAAGRKYPKMRVVLTLGERGSRFIGGGETFSVDAVKVNAVDTTGAGDTFTGYFLAGIVGGATTRDAMETASRAAAIAVTRKGAAESVPRREEI